MAVTMTAPAQREREGAYARLEERILARDQVGASQVFYDLVKSGRPVDELVRLAKDRDVDLMVIGNRGLNSLAGRLLGSVPANVSHRVQCDVLIVHTTGRGRS